MSNFTQKKNRSNKYNGDKDEKALYKVKDNAAFDKTMKKLRNNIDIRLASSKKRLSKMDIKIKIYVTKNIWQ